MKHHRLSIFPSFGIYIKLGRINKSTYIICNGYKLPNYQKAITELINDGFNVMPVLDNLREIEYYEQNVTAESVNFAIRIATDEEPNFAFYTSRLGVRYSDINDLYKDKIQNNPKFKLKKRCTSLSIRA